VPSKEEETVQMATNVLDEVMAIPANAIPQSLLSKARAVAIVPNVVKGGFVIGIRHGRGVVLIRDDAGNWQAPLFISLTSGSVGWQAGVQATDLIMVFQTRKSVNSLMNGRLTLGVDAAAAAGPVGRQATAATDVTLSAEILSYSRSRGLFAGFALDGAGIQIDNLAAASYYHGQGAGPNAWAGTPVVPPSAVALVNRLALYTGAPPVAAPAAANPGGDARAAGELMRQQVVAAWQRLAALLDPNWQAYLQPPRELLAGGVPATEAVTAALQHYEAVAVDPKYAPLSQRPEFTSTHQLLREYLTLRSQEDPANLRLPPPP
jgi:lipid-binding SYLF domain-containing protein